MNLDNEEYETTGKIYGYRFNCLKHEYENVLTRVYFPLKYVQGRWIEMNEELTADEMFDKLGYKKSWIMNILHYEQDITSDNGLGIYHINGIEFVCNHNCISIFSKVGNEKTYGAFNGLDMELLQAINKKCKELGWIK